MSHQAETHDDLEPEGASRFAAWLIFAGVAMMALAGGFMWWRFGPSMFMNLITAAANCF